MQKLKVHLGENSWNRESPWVPRPPSSPLARHRLLCLSIRCSHVSSRFPRGLFPVLCSYVIAADMVLLMCELSLLHNALPFSLVASNICYLPVPVGRESGGAQLVSLLQGFPQATTEASAGLECHLKARRGKGSFQARVVSGKAQVLAGCRPCRASLSVWGPPHASQAGLFHSSFKNVL